MARKLLKKEFSLADFREAMLAMRKLGSLDSMTQMIPGMKQIANNPRALETAEKEIKKTIAIVDSMTEKERIESYFAKQQQAEADRRRKRHEGRRH